MVPLGPLCKACRTLLISLLLVCCLLPPGKGSQGGEDYIKELVEGEESKAPQILLL